MITVPTRIKPRTILAIACAGLALAGCGGGTEDMLGSSGISKTAAVTEFESARARLDAAAAVANARADDARVNLQQALATEVAGASFAPSSSMVFPPLGFPGYRTGQSFTATNTGVLATVSVLVQPCTTNNPDILVEIRAGTSITSPVVATGTIPGAAAGPRARGCGFRDDPVYWVSGDVRASNFTVTAGQVYSIWPSTPTEAYAWIGATGYQGGNFIQPSLTAPGGYTLDPQADVGFRTTVLVR